MKMTITTEVPLVDEVVISVSSEVKCSFYSCQNKESAFNFDADFFDADSDMYSSNRWSRYQDNVSDLRYFNTESEMRDFAISINNYRIRETDLVDGRFLIRWWGRQMFYYCEEHSANCGGCSLYMTTNFSTYIGENYYCEDCRDNDFSYCDSCSEWVESVSELEGDYMCSYCLDSSGAQWCDYCDSWEQQLCDQNFDPEDLENWNNNSYEGIMNYSFKPRRPDFFMGSADSDDLPLFYGVELEVESMDNSMTDGMNIIKESLGDLVYFKADGSLDRGYEAVTFPFSFNYYSEAFDFGFLPKLQELGYRSWSAGTCGLHVHISRTGFASSGHVWKFAQLILSNPYAWGKLAGRTSSRWASFDLETNSVMKVLKGEQFPQRYCAVNLSNTDTVEVRIFRGSLNERRVRSAIESVDCAIQYTRGLSVHDINQGALKFGRFADWVNENRTECASFIDLMCEYGLVPSLKAPDGLISEVDNEAELLLGTESIASAVLLTGVENLLGSLSVLTTDVEN
jgi:hypothetical protein